MTKRDGIPDLSHWERTFVGGSRRYQAAKIGSPPMEHEALFQVFFSASERERFAEWLQEGPVALEIGFRRCHHLKERALRHPTTRFLGVEVEFKWIARMVRTIDRLGLDNVGLVPCDVRELIPDLLSPGSLTKIYTLFPDPWWKEKHARRRLMTKEFVEVMSHLVVPGGTWLVKTDVALYARHIENLFAGCLAWQPSDAVDDSVPSHREKVCTRLGTPVHTMGYLRKTLESPKE